MVSRLPLFLDQSRLLRLARRIIEATHLPLAILLIFVMVIFLGLMLSVEWESQNFFYFWTENYRLLVVQKIIQAKMQLVENISYYRFQFLLNKIGQAQYFFLRNKIDVYRLWIICIFILKAS